MNDLTGKQFGRLKAICPVGRDSSRKVIWECQCICGKVLNVRGDKLSSGATKSCGCSRIIHGDAIKKKGHNRNQLYRLWERLRKEKPSLCDKMGWGQYVVFRNWATEHEYNHDLDDWDGVVPEVIAALSRVE